MTLEATDIVWSYRSRANERPTLDHVSLTARRGELLAIVGPNGSGKSTLLSVLAGERTPHGGTVSIDGIPLHALRPVDLARRRAVLPQHPALTAGYSVGEVVAMGRAPWLGVCEPDEDLRACALALEHVGLRGFAERRYHELSGGERQRVQLARVLAQVWPNRRRTAGWVLLDEPTSALDMAHVDVLLGRVRALTRAGLGAIAVLHDPNTALRYADRVVVMRAGELAADAEPLAALAPDVVRDVFDIETRLESTSTGAPFLISLPSSPPLPEVLP